VPVTGPRAHPDHDLLADLAAEVLPDDLAGRVRSHVDRCADCADLLNQAEGMRSMLRADDPGPMPVDVAARLDDVLAQLRAGTLDVTATEPDDPEVEARWNAVAREPIAAWDSQPVRHRPAEDAGERVTRLHRATDGPVRERRTSLDEQRSDERVGRWRRRVFAAAAAVVVVGAGGALVRAVETGSFGEAPTSAGSSADAGSDAGSGEGGPARPESASEPNTASGRSSKAGAAPVLQTGTNYTDAAFATQARQLIATARTPSSLAQQDEGSTYGGSATASAATDGNQTLRDPAALQACLTALGATSVQPVAVDLAKYQGRESAVLVVREAGGTYDVWVVARDCRPGADGTLKYATITP
jgi:hypothetical protein